MRLHRCDNRMILRKALILVIVAITCMSISLCVKIYSQSLRQGRVISDDIQLIRTTHDIEIEKGNGFNETAPILLDFSHLNEFECVAWRATEDCIPFGNRETDKDGDCGVRINRGRSGFCEIRHKKSGTLYQVLPTHCDTVKQDVYFTCSQFELLLTYGYDAIKYIHDEEFTFQLESKSIHRGIVMVVHGDVLLSAYASVRLLRSYGSILPIEMWFKRSEVEHNHPILHELTTKYDVVLHEIKDPRATKYMTKLHAVFYSSFDQILFLDADNFCVRDPTYLFYHPIFLETGAVFWPDYWGTNTTIFFLHANSLVWNVFQVPFMNMMEQESGQLLIDRRRHMRALNVLMYYGFTTPRVWEDLKLVWGDKDLFRFAWMRTNSSFHMITRPPSSAGRKHHEFDYFCGMTMIQYDLNNEILFMHRNAVKFSEKQITTEWLYIQQFKYASRNANDYVIKDRYVYGSNTFGNYSTCFGRFDDYHELFTVDPIEAFPFAQMEATLQNYIRIGMAIEY